MYKCSFLPILSNTCSFLVLKEYQVLLIVVLICISVAISGSECVFMFSDHLFSLENFLFKSVTHLKSQYILLLLLSCRSSLCILGSPHQIRSTSFSSHPGLSFHCPCRPLMYQFFCRPNLLVLFCFFFCSLWFWCHSQEIPAKSYKTFLCFSQNFFTVLVFDLFWVFCLFVCLFVFVAMGLDSGAHAC
jgi:hypothetical protein